jgi:phosphoribosyl 1,2-cyclic phosphodiesterase
MLGSGSGGNAVLIECDGARLLVDCGFGTRTLAGRLRTIGVEPESIDACVVTHAHTDHVKGAASAAKRWGWSLHATPGTAAAPELTGASVHTFEPGATIDFTRMSVSSTATPHDATQSVGFVVTSRSTGARAALFYDIGHVTPEIAQACDALDILVLESNHDVEMLRNGPYPRFLQARIACRTGHLSNRDAGLFARGPVSRGLHHLVLAHLSEQNNTEHVALASMGAALKGSRFRGTVTAARQDSVMGPFMPSAMRAEPPVQYSLGL